MEELIFIIFLFSCLFCEDKLYVQSSFLARVFSILHSFFCVWYLMYILRATGFPCKNGKVREMELKEVITCVKTLKPSECFLASLGSMRKMCFFKLVEVRK